MITKLAIILLALAASGQVEAEAESDAPAAASAENKAAPEDTPETAPTAAPETDDRPVRPRRGPAPTADRVSGVEYVPNPDGTVRRETTVLGERASSSEAESDEVGSTRDITQPPPERAKVGSIHDTSDVDSNLTVEESAPWNGVWILAAIAGGLVLVGMAAGFYSRRRAK